MMETLELIEYLKRQGRVTMEGDEENGWVVTWVRGGEKFASVSRNLRLALDGVYNAAVNAFAPGARR